MHLPSRAREVNAAATPMRAPEHANLPLSGSCLRVCIADFTGEDHGWGARADGWELVRALNGHWTSPEPFALSVVPAWRGSVGDAAQHGRIETDECAQLMGEAPSADARARLLSIANERYGPQLSHIESSDLVVVQAPGRGITSVGDGGTSLPLLAWLAKCVFNKPVICQAGSRPPTGSSVDAAWTATLARCDQVWVQDPATVSWLKSQGCPHAKLVPSSAFLTDPLDHGQLRGALSGRPFFCVTGIRRTDEEASLAMLRAVRAIADRTGLMPVFAGFPAPGSRLLSREVEAWAPGSFCVMPRDLSYQAVAYHLARGCFVVGGDYLLSVLAAIDGTPSIALESDQQQWQGLQELLGADWPMRCLDDLDGVLDDAVRHSADTGRGRDALRARVEEIRREHVASLQDWQCVAPSSARRHAKELRGRPAARPFATDDLTPHIQSLTIYLRRGAHAAATFRCLRQIVEGDTEFLVRQLSARWLVSVCDSYSDHGDPIAARNAALISTFVTWERLAATHARWADPARSTNQVDSPVPADNVPLWSGLQTIHLRRGDTTCNLLARLSRLLGETPHLLLIWREILRRIRDSDSVLAALNRPHGHMFDEDLAWMAGDAFPQVAPWRKPSLEGQGQD